MYHDDFVGFFDSIVDIFVLFLLTGYEINVMVFVIFFP